MASQDTEITLGIGKLLGIFFALAALCAVFLGVGYSLGKNSAKAAMATSDPTQVAEGSTTKPAGGTAVRPAPTENKDLSFYKAVEQKQPDANLTTPDADKTSDTTAPKTAPAPEISRPGSGYVVQVAAVSKQEDAEALADALRKKSYMVQISNPPNDKLFHVQVGPFNDIADAESTRNRLVGDGYNPILKK